ncbi:MAG: 50S ribosomal protein L22 [Chloroflexi bacterium]|nr:MAG: 50S ribosomal protein L22 [Chloroflexota bacterium]
MEVVATAKWVRTTARKARLVAGTVEGLPVSDALTLLRFTPRAAATDVAKVIKSAAANAEHNYNLDASTLRVARIEIEAAGIIKRFRPRAQGRAFSVFKRTTHLRAFVVDDVVASSRRVRRAAPAATAPPEAPAAPTRAPRRRAAAAPTPAAPRPRRTRTKPAPEPAAEPQESTETEAE